MIADGHFNFPTGASLGMYVRVNIPGLGHLINLTINFYESTVKLINLTGCLIFFGVT